MDPYVYFAYLCLLDNDSQINQAFKEWRREHMAPSKYKYGISYSRLEREIQNVCWVMSMKYKRLFIYEAEKIWDSFNASKFISFLERHGLEK